MVGALPMGTNNETSSRLSAVSQPWQKMRKQQEAEGKMYGQGRSNFPSSLRCDTRHPSRNKDGKPVDWRMLGLAPGRRHGLGEATLRANHTLYLLSPQRKRPLFYKYFLQHLGTNDHEAEQTSSSNSIHTNIWRAKIWQSTILLD